MVLLYLRNEILVYRTEPYSLRGFYGLNSERYTTVLEANLTLEKVGLPGRMAEDVYDPLARTHNASVLRKYVVWR